MSNVPSGPPPVEPMSDVAWARVERGLMQRLDQEIAAPIVATPRRRWIWIAAPALAVAAAIALVLGLRTSPDPVTSGEPSRVVAGDAPSSVSFADAHLALAARSAIVMSNEAGSPSVLVERGEVEFTVAPRAERPPFVVRAGDVVVRVVGTKFEVARFEERVTVGVDHGIVDVVFRGATVRVGAQQRWSSESPEAVSTIALAAPGPGVPTSRAQTAAQNSAAQNVGAQAAAQNVGAQVAAQIGDARDSGAQNSGARDNAPQNPAKSTIAPSAAATNTTKPGAGSTSSVTTAVPATTAPPAARPPTVAPVDDQREFERLAALEPKDPAAAIAGYLAISRGSSAWAGNALFAAGRLAADRKDPRAKTFLQIYLRRFPNGSNAADARTLLDSIQGATP